MLALFRREGFLGARVEPRIAEDRATNGRRVTFSITAGQRARIGAVRVTGAGRSSRPEKSPRPSASKRATAIASAR